ncbi:MAG: hypothetical protein WAV04_02890 [Candidatus Microsaccharimonas sp.]
MKIKKEELGWEDWHKIRDPTGFIDIEPYAFDRVEGYHYPQEIQDMFDKYGVEETVLRINREYLIRHDRYALELVKGRHMTILRRARPS